MPNVAIRVLGCGDAFGSGGRFQTCFFVTAGRDRFLIDCGATSLVAMRRFGVDPGTIDTVFLSHLHGDHYAGLPFLLLEAQFVSERTRPLTIVGPPGTGRRLLDAQELLFPDSGRMSWRFPLRFVELEAGRTEICGGVSVAPYLVEHPAGAPSFALRFACRKRLIAYSGDTKWTESLREVARDADLLITECYAFDGEPRFHLDYATLSVRLPELGAKRVLLTHLSRDMLEHLDQLDLEVATDGMTIDL